MAKTGLDELFKIATKVSSNGYSSSKTFNDLVDKLGKTLKAKKTMETDASLKPTEGRAQSSYTREQLKQDESRQVSRNVSAENAKKTVEEQVEAVNTVNSTTKSTEVFGFEITDQQLVDGLILSEVLGRPASKRRRGHGRFR